MKPIVFLGPSIELTEARAVVDADFRPPCRRGDLSAIEAPRVVAIIDGVFEQSLSVSPNEIVNAIRRGLYVCGGGSMGALRAAEVPQMRGVGRVYEMYRSGLIDGDDEVALMFDSDRLVPLSVPLVNVRFALEQLIYTGTISADDGHRILTTARSLHFKERTYKRIFRELGVTGQSRGSEELLSLFQAHDLKRADALRVLEHIANGAEGYDGAMSTARDAVRTERLDASGVDPLAMSIAAPVLEPGTLLIWETGDHVACAELLDFLVITNRFPRYASRILCRLLLANALTDLSIAVAPALTARRELRQYGSQWGWRTREEETVTLADLGLSVRDVLEGSRSDALARGAYQALMHSRPPAFLKAFKLELFVTDLALKRETLVYASIRHLAQSRGRGRQGDLEWARSLLCRLHATPVWEIAQARILQHGVSRRRLRCVLSRLARAHAVVASPRHSRVAGIRIAAVDRYVGLQSSKKPPGEERFAVAIVEALSRATTIKGIIGVTRIGLIGGLTDLRNVFISQVARPGGAWSSSYGSGKSTTRDGAIVGGIMEEAEKWANEQYRGEPIRACYADLAGQRRRAVNPETLALPYDSEYTPATPLMWQSGVDLLNGREVLIPLAAVACHFHAGRNNPFYSKRAGRVVFSTNGLASAFNLAEALVHAVCESIERHNTKIVEIQIENPGLERRTSPPRGLDMHRAPVDIQDLIHELRQRGYTPQLFDISADIKIPTVAARLLRDGVIYSGWGAHPNPSVACRAALLEACQTVATMTAGGREDLSVRARSLGRHERPRPNRDAAFVLWGQYHADSVPFEEMAGCVSDDVYDEFKWVRSQLADAGFEQLISVDLTREELLPARVVRVVVPGLETTNPFNCGPRARRTLAAEVLDR